jgi:hypothetical protein
MTDNTSPSTDPKAADIGNTSSASETLRTPLTKRTVSFSPTSDVTESSNFSSLASAASPSSAAMTPSNSGTGGSNTLKPALKPGTDRKKLPPTAQYQHPDPLLRRLRLVDNVGDPVDLRSFFKGVKAVAFYFSSQWAGQPLKEYHQVRQHSELSVSCAIYNQY